jgi:hypothetical protein
MIILCAVWFYAPSSLLKTVHKIISRKVYKRRYEDIILRIKREERVNKNCRELPKLIFSRKPSGKPSQHKETVRFRRNITSPETTGKPIKQKSAKVRSQYAFRFLYEQSRESENVKS